MKPVSGKKFCKLLEARGWELRRIAGSHHIYGKAGEISRISASARQSTVENWFAEPFDEDCWYSGK